MTTICKPQNIAKLRQFTNAQYTDTNRALKKLTEIITDVGKQSLPLVTISGHKNGPNKAVSENMKQLTAEKRQFNRTRRVLLSDR